MMKIYTKKGDLGTTTLCDGKKISKDHLRVIACGTIDELNCVIGMLLSYLNSDYLSDFKDIAKEIISLLQRIQKDLLELGSEIANFPKIIIHEKYVERLEQKIDHFSQSLPLLKNFILPSGNIAATTCHFARSVCRRAERHIVALSHQDKVNPILLKYINRLSDLLFVIARSMSNKK